MDATPAAPVRVAAIAPVELDVVVPCDPANLADMVRKACRIAFEEKFAAAGDGVIITAGVPLGTPGTTNMVRMAYLDENGAPLADQG